MSRVLLLVPTTTYRTQAFVQAAARLGVAVTVACDEPSAVTALNPVGLLTLDFADPEHAAEQAADFAAQHGVAAVVPVDDQVTVVAAAICGRLGLPANTVRSAAAARNKHRMRELLAAAGVPSPRFLLASLDEDPATVAERVHYPCVVKPLELAASRGVIRADDPASFVRAVERLRRILSDAASADASRRPEHDSNGPHGAGRTHPADPAADPSRHYLAEDFLPGPEVAVEGLLSKGELHVLAIFDKPDPLDGPFFEETIYVTPSRLPAATQDLIARSVAAATRAVGLDEGPVHAELRVNAAGAWIVEVAGRSIGGLCSRVLRFGLGISLEELIIRHAIEPGYRPPRREQQAAGVMMIPIPSAGTLGAVHGLDEARAVPGVEDIVISAHRGKPLVPLPEGGNYLGFIFARGVAPADAEQALRAAHARLAFDIQN